MLCCCLRFYFCCCRFFVGGGVVFERLKALGGRLRSFLVVFGVVWAGFWSSWASFWAPRVVLGGSWVVLGRLGSVWGRHGSFWVGPVISRVEKKGAAIAAYRRGTGEKRREENNHEIVRMHLNQGLRSYRGGAQIAACLRDSGKQHRHKKQKTESISKINQKLDAGFYRESQNENDIFICFRSFQSQVPRDAPQLGGPRGPKMRPKWDPRGLKSESETIRKKDTF